MRDPSHFDYSLAGWVSFFFKSFGCKCVLNKHYPTSDYHFRRWRLFAVEMWLPKKREA